MNDKPIPYSLNLKEFIETSKENPPLVIEGDPGQPLTEVLTRFFPQSEGPVNCHPGPDISWPAAAAGLRPPEAGE